VVQVEIPATAGELSLLRFRVRDTGPGVQDEKREQIFEGFLQGDGSATRKHGGAGVGLAICRQLAELLGGRLGLESQSGDGSLFWFEIPVDVIDASPVLQRSAQPYGGVLALVRSPGWRDALYQWAEWLPVSTEVELTRELDAEAVERRFSACALPPMLFLETSLLPKTGAAVILEKLALSAAAKGGGLVVAGPGAAEMQTGAAWEPGVCFVNAMAITEWCRIFRMDFPQSSEFQSAEHGSEKSEAAAHPLALVIEDNDVQQKMLEATLLRLGWEVLVRDNPVGIEALIAESRPTLILLDLTLAGHSAHAVARRIREAEHNNGKAACAMVGLSSRSRHSDLEACLSVGMNDCLVKPLAESALEEVVRRHCKLPTAWSASDQRKRRGPAMDFHRIESLCGGDEAMVKELLERFRKELPSRIAAISHELSRQNAKAFQTEVERLHGSLLDLDCKSASAVTSRLLKVEPATLWLRGERLLAELTGELDLVRTAIEERVGSATEIHSA